MPLSLPPCQLGNDGTVPFRHGERVDFKYLITHKFVGDTVKLDILREGKEMVVEVGGREGRGGRQGQCKVWGWSW